MTDFDAAWNAVAGVQGWMTRGQGQALFAAAQRCPEHGTIVEIGSFQGRSTIVLAMAAPSTARIIAIDPHAGNDRGPEEIDGYADAAAGDHQAFLGNLTAAGVNDRVTHLRMFSDDAHVHVDDPIDVLYVDGAHRYRPARTDIRDWGKRVGDGGTLLIHDSFSSVGVTLAIVRELMFGRRFRYVGRSRSLTTYRADLNGTGARVGNAVRQATQLVWFVKNLVLKLMLKLGLGKLIRRFGGEPPEWPY